MADDPASSTPSQDENHDLRKPHRLNSAESSRFVPMESTKDNVTLSAFPRKPDAPSSSVTSRQVRTTYTPPSPYLSMSPGYQAGAGDLLRAPLLVRTNYHPAGDSNKKDSASAATATESSRRPSHPSPRIFGAAEAHMPRNSLVWDGISPLYAPTHETTQDGSSPLGHFQILTTPRNTIIECVSGNDKTLSPLESSFCTDSGTNQSGDGGPLGTENAQQEEEVVCRARDGDECRQYTANDSTAMSLQIYENDEETQHTFYSAAQFTCGQTSRRDKSNLFVARASPLSRSSFGVDRNHGDSLSENLEHSSYQTQTESPLYAQSKPTQNDEQLQFTSDGKQKTSRQTHRRINNAWILDTSTRGRNNQSFSQSDDNDSLADGLCMSRTSMDSCLATPSSARAFSMYSPCLTGDQSPAFSNPFESGGPRRYSRRLDSMTTRLPTPPSSLRKELPVHADAAENVSVARQDVWSPLFDDLAFGQDPHDDTRTISSTAGECARASKATEWIMTEQCCSSAASTGSTDFKPAAINDNADAGHLLSPYVASRESLSTRTSSSSRQACLLSPEGQAGWTGPRELVQSDGRTILPTILEDIVVLAQAPVSIVSKVNELEALLAQTSTEKRLLEVKIATLSKAHEDRATPFQHVFEENRKLRARHEHEMKLLKSAHAEELQETVEFTTLVTEKLGKAVEKIQALQAENQTLQAENISVKEALAKSELEKSLLQATDS